MLTELRMTMDEPPHFNELCRQVGCVVLGNINPTNPTR